MIGNDYSILGKYADAEIVKSQPSHAEYLQHHLRETDRRECMIANCTPWRALLKSFVKFSYDIVEYFQNKYYLLENIVPVEHSKTLKWLEYLGFFIHRKPFLINEYKVYRFVRCQSESVEIIV